MKAYSEQHRPVHISLSGGSTPKLLFKTLAQAPLPTKFNGKTSISGGEMIRMVPPQDPESNYGEVQKLLFDHIQIPAENIHRIRGEEKRRARIGKIFARIDLLRARFSLRLDYSWNGQRRTHCVAFPTSNQF